MSEMKGHYNLCLSVLVMYICCCITQAADVPKLPIIVRGPIGTNEINTRPGFISEENSNHDSNPRPTVVNMDIKSEIRKHYEKTVVKSFVKNPSIRNSQEIAFTVELPSNNYHVTNLTVKVLGDKNVYVARHENEDDVEATFERSAKKGETVVLAKELKKSSLESHDVERMVSINAHIPPGEKIFLILEYEGPLKKNENNSWIHNLRVNPHQTVQDFTINIYINDTLPIVDPESYEIRNELPVFNYSSNTFNNYTPEYIHISFTPEKDSKDLVNGEYDMSGTFYTTYSLDKKHLLSKVGQDIADITSFDGYEKMVEDIFNGLEFVFHFIFMLPFIIMTEMMNSLLLMVSVFTGEDTDWYLDEKQWYESEFEKEFAKLENSFEHTFEDQAFPQESEFEALKLPRVESWLYHTSYQWMARMFK